MVVRMLSPKKIARIIADTMEPEKAPHDVSHSVMVIMRTSGGPVDEDDLLAKAEKLKGRVLEGLRAIEGECFSHGISPRFSFNTSSGYLIQGSCFIQPDDVVTVAESKRRRLNVWKYVDAFSVMDPLRFEKVCCGVLTLLGVQDAVTTPRSGDDGVDFFGNLALGNLQQIPLLTPNFASHLRVVVIGQAKRYTQTGAGTPELRELFGAIELAKAGVTEITDVKRSRLAVRVADPIIYLFVTSGQLSRKARELLSRSGVIGVDGSALATFLADHAIGVDAAGVFDRTIFDQWAN